MAGEDAGRLLAAVAATDDRVLPQRPFDTGPGDDGLHTVCAKMTKEFYVLSARQRPSTPVPEFGFPGLKPGDWWYLCCSLERGDGAAVPPVRLAGTHFHVGVRAAEELMGVRSTSKPRAAGRYRDATPPETSRTPAAAWSWL